MCGMKAAACLRLLVALVASAAHAEEPSSAPSGTDAAAQLDFILDNPLDESAYASVDRCLFPNRYRTVEVLDTRHLLFIGEKDTVWLNQLRSNCVGLTKDAVLVFEMRQRSLCELDGFRTAPRYSGFGGDFTAHCTLGHFERISIAQADVLREAFARRKAPQSKEEPQESQKQKPKEQATHDE